MPQQTSFNVDINFPAIIGDMIITPDRGVALETLFTIQAKDVYDED